jgi:di/tricarboxylate transporter
MSLDAWIAIGVVLTIFPLMALSRLGSDVILLGAVMLLLVLGVLSPEEALGGFSHSGLFTVACMYVLVAGIRETGGIDLLVRHVLGRPRS